MRLTEGNQVRTVVDRDRSLYNQPNAVEDLTLPTAQKEIARSIAQGAFGAVVPRNLGGLEWDPERLLNLYHTLAKADLTSTFLVSQRNSALRWIMKASNKQLVTALVTQANTDFIATQAISHLSPSGSRSSNCVVAVKIRDGFELNGKAPWVSGISYAEFVVVGARLNDQREIVALVPKSSFGLRTSPITSLHALSDSDSAQLNFENVYIGNEYLLMGPGNDLVTREASGRIKPYPPLHTSMITLGHTDHVLDELRQMPSNLEVRDEVVGRLSRETTATRERVLALARECENILDHREFEDVRIAANVLSVRAAQALLVVSKGSGFIIGSTAERIIRESIFFLVWANSQRISNQMITLLCSPMRESTFPRFG